MSPASEVLPDILGPGLKVVFCGTAAGRISAREGAYYAGPGNLFWQMLYQMGLTPRVLEPHEYVTVRQYGIGLTDLAKHTSGADKSLRVQDFDTAALRWKIKMHAPLALAFNGKRAAQEFYGRRNIPYGRLREPLGSTAVFVLPSTSSLARRFWDESAWMELAEWLREREGQRT
ncbi:MAG: mismatch-specific DNA-glycosylase [Chloroflexota bacterium]|mgnify:CR=1 FL=1|nr:MAG: mismatch-specific DNA-glycosylase [Chloroflexota bacterium]